MVKLRFQQWDDLDPDIIFLDIEMPDMNGFQFLEQFPDELPEVILATAYNEFATEAYNVEALDYILKPVQHEPFGERDSEISR